MGLLRALYLPERSLLRERLRWRSLLRLLFLSRLLLLFLPFFLSLSLLLLLLFLEPGLRLLLRLLLFLKLFTTNPTFWKNKTENPIVCPHLFFGNSFDLVDKKRTQEHLLLVLVIVPVSMRGFDLILSKVDRRTSWGRRWNISSRQGKGEGVGQEKKMQNIFNY